MLEIENKSRKKKVLGWILMKVEVRIELLTYNNINAGKTVMKLCNKKYSYFLCKFVGKEKKRIFPYEH